MKNITSVVGLSATLALSFSAYAFAQTITTTPASLVGPTKISSTTNVAPAYGFELFDVASPSGVANTNVESLPSFVSSITNAALFNAGTNYSTVTVDGTAYETGVNYVDTGYPSPSGAISLLSTITLTGSVPISFTLGVLTDNIAAGSTPNTLYLALNGSSIPVASTATAGPSTGGTDVDDFYYFTVTGATAGDTITVSAQTGTALAGRYPEIGGLTFDAVVSPEPSTWALMGVTALLGLFFRRRAQNP